MDEKHTKYFKNHQNSPKVVFTWTLTGGINENPTVWLGGARLLPEAVFLVVCDPSMNEL